MEYCELSSFLDVKACAKEGWRLAFVTKSHIGFYYVMQRSLATQPSYPIYMTAEGPLALNTPEAWKRYYEERTLSPQ